MKKYVSIFTVVAVIFAAGCTDFGEENQLTLPGAPAIEISNLVAEAKGDSITFKVTPATNTGFYSWVVVQSETADETLSADHILKQQITGVAKGYANYAVRPDTIVGVGKLVPFTVYQIYAVAANTDGIVSAVKVASVKTQDDGGAPAPQTVAISGTTVTLTFHEPLQRGAGKVYVSYFAKNTVSGDPLVITPGADSFNPQDLEIAADSLSVSGKNLIIQLPGAPAGAYASITYEAGAVTDLEGNATSAFSTKANRVVSGVPTGGITVRIATKAWALNSEFEDPQTVETFAVWDDLVISAIPEEGIVIGKKVTTVVPTVIYKESGKTTTIDVTSWGTVAGVPAFLLPEEPARGAIVDLNVPAGAYEDVYGNTSNALTIAGHYLYSYGYTLSDIVGTYEIAGINASTGATIAPETVIIVADEGSSNENAVLIKNLAKNITGQDSEVEAVFDPVGGTLTVPDWQILAVDWAHPSAGITADVLFSTYSSPEIVFSVTSSGHITSASDIWGYYFAKDETEDYYGALRWYDPSSEWTRTSSTTASTTAVRASVKAATQKNTQTFLKHRNVFVN
jgi:hypothetical protein